MYIIIIKLVQLRRAYNEESSQETAKLFLIIQKNSSFFSTVLLKKLAHVSFSRSTFSHVDWPFWYSPPIGRLQRKTIFLSAVKTTVLYDSWAELNSS